MGIGLKRGFAYAKLKQEKNKVTTSLLLSIIINIFIKAYKTNPKINFLQIKSVF